MSKSKLPQILLGSAKVILGVAFVHEGIKSLSPQSDEGDERSKALLGNKQQLSGTGDPKSQKKKSTMVSVQSVDDRARLIKDQINKSSLMPDVIEDARKILGKKCGDKWCVAERDYIGEIKALYYAVKNVQSPYALRYVRDHLKVDQYPTARAVQRMGSGDCDCMVVRVGALAMAVGYPVRLRIVQTAGFDDWNHIYLTIGTPPSKPTRWIPIDLTERSKPFGWEVEGANDCKLSGRASGEVLRVKDVDV